MESKDKKVELLQIAIKQLIGEEVDKSKISKNSSDDTFVAVRSHGEVDTEDDEDDAAAHRLLSKLLAQLETLKEDGTPPEDLDIQKAVMDGTEEVAVAERNEATAASSETGKEDQEEDIVVKELKKLRKQNFITHCLLSAMIVLTVAWQLSEVSLIFKVKQGLSNPFKTLGEMFKGMVIKTSPSLTAGQEEEKHGQGKPSPLLTTSSLPGLKVPEIPHVEFPVFDLDSEQE